MTAIEASGLGKRYGSAWALRDCTLAIPQGSVTALVGPNGAGKTTLLHLAVGLGASSEGELRVLGREPRHDAASLLPEIGFVAQDHPLYAGFSVGQTLELGRRLNRRWDGELARSRVDRLGLPLRKKVGRLSGGSRPRSP